MRGKMFGLEGPIGYIMKVDACQLTHYRDEMILVASLRLLSLRFGVFGEIVEALSRS